MGAQQTKTSAAMQQAANQGKDARPEDGCCDCNKVGLAILPVVPTVAPNRLRTLNAELKALDDHYKAEDLEEHWYLLRTLPAGYLYVMKPDLSWDCYLVDSEGLLRMMAPADAPADPASVKPMSESCKRHGDNIPAQVIAIDPTKHAAVWMAFSRFRWTAKVMSDYAANKKNCRDRRMTKVDVMAAAAGNFRTSSKAANAVRFGIAMTENVGQYVADYASYPINQIFKNNLANPPHLRANQGKRLADRMAEISKNTAGKTGAIIALRDDLGIAMDLNTLRNAETANLGAYIAENQRKRFVGMTIKGFEKAFAENGQSKEWNERFRKHYDGPKIDADLKAFDDKAKPWEKRINAMSRDVATLNGKAGLDAWWRDFDPTDDQSAKDRQRATGLCLHATVKTKEEQALWDKWFNEDPTDPFSTLWGAVTALDPKLGEFLKGKKLPDAGKLDKFNDIAKNIHDARNDFFERIKKRDVEEAMAMIGLAMASQITRLKSVNPSLYQVAGARVLIATAARTAVVATPVFMSVTKTQESLMLAEAAFGPPEAGLKRLLDIEMKTSKRVYVVGSNGVDAYAFEGVQTTTEKARVVELWLPDEVAKDMPKLPAGAMPAALPPPKVNPYQGLIRFSKTLPGAFAWAGLTLQALNLTSSAKEFIDTQDNTTDAYFGIASGSLGVIGVMNEIGAGAMKHMGTRFAASTVAKVAFAGGLLAGLSAIAEGVQLAIKAAHSFNNEDSDAGWLYTGSAGFVLLSGALGVLGALAVASEAGALTGMLAFLATAGSAAATIPVWGWIAAGVIFLGIGLVLLWQAIKATDTPMEEWLKRCVYGVGSKRFDMKEEMEKLNDIAYAMSIEVEWNDDPWEWSNKSFVDDYDSFRFDIGLPGLGAESVIECRLFLIGSGGKEDKVYDETIRPRMLGKQPIDPNITVVKPWDPGVQQFRPPSYVWHQPPRIRDGGKRLLGIINMDDDVYSKAKLEIKYWPNAATMPTFVLPKAFEQRTVIAED